MEPLTSRETEVLWWLGQGFTYERIGGRLRVSLHTVATHIKSIYRKLEVHCAAAAVRRGVELGLLGHSGATASSQLRPHPLPGLGPDPRG